MARPKKKSLPILRWLLLPLIPILWCVASSFGLLEFFENRTIDWRFRWRGEIAAPIKIIYVDVDSRSIDDIGNWQWSREYFAHVTRALLDHAHVRAIGYDFVLVPKAPAEIADLERMRAGDVALGRLVFKPMAVVPPPVVFAASFAAGEFRAAEGVMVGRGLPLIATDSRQPSEIEPPEQTALMTPSGVPLSPPLLGLIDTLHAGTRTVAAWAPTRTRDYYHMAIELARLHWGLPIGSVRRLADRLEFVRPEGEIVAQVPMRDGQLVDINWFSPWDSPHNPRESFSIVYAYATLLEGSEEEQKTARAYFAQEDWKDAIVLIGPVDPLMQDLAVTPLDDKPVPKVGVHGNLLKTIVSGLFLKQLAPWAEHAITFGLTLAVIVLASVGGVRGRWLKSTAFLLAVGYVGSAFFVFEQQHLILPLAAPFGAVFTTTFTAIVWQLIVEEKQKGRIKGMFGAYVSPQLVNRMVESGEDPQLGGHDSEITAYFSDIQGFSTFSEKLGSGPLVQLMNEYLTACTDIVQEEGGTLDKYIGDAVVAMFGAPIAMKDHAYRACVATQRVHAKIAELREKWKNEGEKWPEIVWKMQSRIGLNSGVCMIGNMGSRTRFNYTMMGDDVNLAARMESGAKSWGCYTMVTQATKQRCEEHGGDRVVFRPLGQIVVMGRSQPVPIFEIVGLKESIGPTARECIEIFGQALAKYYARDWNGALELFKQSAALEPNQPGKTVGVKTNPSLVYIEKVVPEAIEDPPAEGWDGRYVMKEK